LYREQTFTLSNLGLIVGCIHNFFLFFYISCLKEQCTHQCYILAVHDITVSVRGDCRSSASPHQHLIVLLLLSRELKSSFAANLMLLLGYGQQQLSEAWDIHFWNKEFKLHTV
jgi:hypothetical protein